MLDIFRDVRLGDFVHIFDFIFGPKHQLQGRPFQSTWHIIFDIFIERDCHSIFYI